MTFRRISNDQWEWTDGTKHFAARLFESTHRLIWSSWSESAEAPQFDEGTVQTFDDFLKNGAPLTDLPAKLSNEIRSVVETLAQRH